MPELSLMPELCSDWQQLPKLSTSKAHLAPAAKQQHEPAHHVSVAVVDV
jgi:hypothetical protein